MRDDQRLGPQQLLAVEGIPVFGAPILATWAWIAERRVGGSEAVRWIIWAIVLYVVCFFVTSSFNIPLNDESKNAGDPARIVSLAQPVGSSMGRDPENRAPILPLGAVSDLFSAIPTASFLLLFKELTSL